MCYDCDDISYETTCIENYRKEVVAAAAVLFFLFLLVFPHCCCLVLLLILEIIPSSGRHTASVRGLELLGKVVAVVKSKVGSSD